MVKALATVLVLTSVAAAQEPPPVMKVEAGSYAARLQATRIFARGQAAYRSGQCRDAARAFADAHTLDPLPSLLFDEGEAWRCEFRLTGYVQAGANAVRRLH